MVIKKILSVFLLISVLFLWGADSALAAAFATHTFDDCAGTSDVATLCEDGGSGWTGNWTTANGFIGKTSGCQSSNCIEDDGAGDNKIYRTFTASANGHGSIYVNRTDANVNNLRINYCADGTTTCEDVGKFYFRLLRSGIPTIGGDVQLGHSAGQTKIGDWTTSTWEVIQYQWGTDGFYDTACSAGEVKANFAGGAFSSCLTMTAGNNPGTVEFTTDDTTGGDSFFLDELTGAEPAVAAGGSAVPGVPLHSRFMFF